MCPNTSREGTEDQRVTAHAPVPFPWGSREKHTRVVPTGPDSSPEQKEDCLKRFGQDLAGRQEQKKRGRGVVCREDWSTGSQGFLPPKLQAL